MFKEKHIGELLDEKISHFIKDYVSKNDIMEVCKKHGASFHTTRFIINRANPLNEKTAKVIKDLMGVAVKNCGNTIKTATIKKNKFSKMLKA